MALCIPAVGESYDCAKAAISLERSNTFPWPEDCVQIHQIPFPSQRVGYGHETNENVHCIHDIFNFRSVKFGNVHN